MDQHMAARWAAADFEDSVYASGCCRQYASTVSRWARKNAPSANSRTQTSANSSPQASTLVTPGAPRSGQRGPIEVVIFCMFLVGDFALPWHPYPRRFCGRTS